MNSNYTHIAVLHTLFAYELSFYIYIYVFVFDFIRIASLACGRAHNFFFLPFHFLCDDDDMYIYTRVVSCELRLLLPKNSIYYIQSIYLAALTGVDPISSERQQTVVPSVLRWPSRSITKHICSCSVVLYVHHHSA